MFYSACYAELIPYICIMETQEEYLTIHKIGEEIKKLRAVQRKIRIEQDLEIKGARSDKGTERQKYDTTLSKKHISYLKRANAKGFGFELTGKHFDELENAICYYCGDAATGFDRVDSKKGYLLTNVVPCCSPCNMMKNAVTVKDFIGKIKKIHSHLNL